jgi:hypothetical protein
MKLAAILLVVAGCADAQPDGDDETSDLGGARPHGDPAGATCATYRTCATGLSCVDSACTPPVSAPMPTGGEAVLDAMQVFTVVWPGDEAVGADVDRFTGALLGSDAWLASVGEYGVGNGAARGVIVLDETPPATIIDDDGSVYEKRIRAVIGATTTAGDVVPAPGHNTVFQFVVPHQTRAPGGYYHYQTLHQLASATGSSLYVPYIAVRQDHVGFVSDRDYLTWSTAHELFETATDPRMGNGYDSPWIGTQGEVGDLCNDIPVTTTLDGTSYAISRAYSAANAAARDVDPCVPALPGPYTNIALRPGRVTVPAAGTRVRLVPFSYGAPHPLTWHLYPGPGFHVSPNHGTNMPGDNVVVTVTRTSSASGPQALQVWIDDADHPNIPAQEWFGGTIVAE